VDPNTKKSAPGCHFSPPSAPFFSVPSSTLTPFFQERPALPPFAGEHRAVPLHLTFCFSGITVAQRWHGPTPKEVTRAFGVPFPMLNYFFPQTPCLGEKSFSYLCLSLIDRALPLPRSGLFYEVPQIFSTPITIYHFFPGFLPPNVTF